MFWRMVFRALGRQKKKMLMIAFTIALGSSLATAMLNVMFDVGDKVNQELKTYGANIRVVPQSESLLTEEFGFDDNVSQFLKEEELGKIKTIFWAFNIVDFAPYFESSAYLKDGEKVSVSGTWFKKHLELPTGETLDTGMTAMKTWWSVQGSWLDDGDDTGAMVGSAFSKRNGISVGDTISLFRKAEGKQRGQTWIVKGIFDSGSDEDEKVYITIKSAQKLFEKPGLVTSIEVSALTTPDNDLARRAAQDPSSLNRNDWDTWYCTAYVSSICYQIQEVISNSCAKAVRQVAESEGAILNKTQLLMLLITILSLIGSALGISNLVTASVMERAQEIGLLKAIGAHDAPISILVLTEILITAILGGIIGYFAGLGFAQIIGQSVFDSAINIKATVIPLVAILIFVVTM
ncbi:MAG: ABC transporter permease, partial [Treponema sp.]|nr:ABC transporter permease [Treponema sp.]